VSLLERIRRRLVIKERAPNHQYMTLSMCHLMEAGGGGSITV
jgi:hypothetical protein